MVKFFFTVNKSYAEASRSDDPPDMVIKTNVSTRGVQKCLRSGDPVDFDKFRIFDEICTFVFPNTCQPSHIIGSDIALQTQPSFFGVHRRAETLPLAALLTSSFPRFRAFL